tara:strand:+ start:445 stop:738 length:294 start_codon:yes stop_codon:yes gene_type:complete
MATPVNPPPFLRLPPDFLKDKQTKSFVEQQNQVIFQLYQKLGGATDPIDVLSNFSSNGFSSEVQFLQRQIDGLPPFTIDTTGFTADLTFITSDKVIA